MSLLTPPKPKTALDKSIDKVVDQVGHISGEALVETLLKISAEQKKTSDLEGRVINMENRNLPHLDGRVKALETKRIPGLEQRLHNLEVSKMGEVQRRLWLLEKKIVPAEPAGGKPLNTTAPG